MSTSVVASKSEGTFLRSIISRHPLTAFFLLAFGLTWPFLIADALGSRGLIPFRLSLEGPGIAVVILMGYGPTFAALIASGVTGGKPGIRSLLRPLLRWRVGIQWYAITILGTGLLFFGAARLYVLVGGTLRAVPPSLWN